jgi:cyanamide hydratase
LVCPRIRETLTLNWQCIYIKLKKNQQKEYFYFHKKKYKMERELFTVGVERDVESLLRTSGLKVPKHFSILDVELPKSKLAEEATAFVKREVDECIFNHSMRCYLYGAVVSQNQFPEWKVDNEQFYLTSIMHDIGLAPKYHLTTSMSFELKGALVSHNFITQSQYGNEATADVVAEAINRHIDFGVGKIQTIGQLIQIAAATDVVGAHSYFYQEQTLDEIVHEWPRKNFNNHIADLLDLEIQHKPGCHITLHSCTGLLSPIRKGNTLMARYDNQ